MMKVTNGGETKKIPAFTSYEVTVQPQQKSAERNGNGKLVRETLPDKWAIQMEWEFGTPEEFYIMFNFLKGLTRVDFNVSFPAPTGKIESGVFYISPISAKLLNFSRGASGWWKTLKCSFVEV
ncbi:hypothetical protein J2T13_004957 [Paenibacillus sp. DS2015]|uniref:DUF6711 family protein n=1 Tax=Paenibacillus sp. DS2015 TaxID=3373917 RepID=UPI003D1A7E03